MKESQRKGLISVHVAVALFGFVRTVCQAGRSACSDHRAWKGIFFIYFPLDFLRFKSRKFAWRRKVIICGWSEQVQF